MPKRSLLQLFCSCIKKVRNTIKTMNKSAKEKGAIGICVKSVLQTRGKTLYKFSCKNKYLKTKSYDSSHGSVPKSVPLEHA